MKKIPARLFLVMAAAAALLLVPHRAVADDDDPPGRVARLNYTHGSVSFQPAGEEEWATAVVNRPITTGDKFWVDKKSRAELHLGSASIRLDQDTGFSFLELSDQVTQIRLTAGTMNIRLRRLDPDETFEVDAPNLAFSLLRPGVYRIDVNEEGDVTNIAVRSGEGEVTGGGQTFPVHAGQFGTFSGNDALASDVGDLRGQDDFDHWCADRDRHEDKAQSARYVSPEVIGYEDLDDYGEWQSAPEYGHIWVPRGVAVGWAPYRYGHWIWVSPWGWTWVDDSPWGFAPFHYGRWVSFRGYWGWVPGPVMARPVYAPALVAWVGGPHFSLSFSVGGVGAGVAWFPLGPREVYVPPYRGSRTYINNVNVTNTTVNNIYVTNVYNNYSNNRVTNVNYINRTAVTATSQATFTSAQPVGRNILHIDQRQIANAPLTPSVGVTPGQRSVLGAGATGPRVMQPPARFQERTVVAKRQPPPPPVPFAAQQRAIQENGGRPMAPSELNHLRPATQSNGQENQQRRVRIAPPVQPVIQQPGSQQGQGGGTVNEAPVQNAKPVQTNQPTNQPPASNERIRNDRPPSAQPAPRPDRNAPVSNPNSAPNRTVNQPGEQMNRPPKDQQPNAQQQRYQQEQERLKQRQQQDQERLRRQQDADRQRLQQQQANQRQQEKLQQKQQQQQEKLQQQHQVQQKKLEQKQQKQQQKDQKQEPKNHNEK
jgi:hypothetical protein